MILNKILLYLIIFCIKKLILCFLRDAEVLKSWRDCNKISKKQMKLLDNYQSYPSKDFADNIPFGIDPDFLKMLSRAEIYRTLKDYENKYKKKRKFKPKITSVDLEREMNEIVCKLQALDTSDTNTNLSSPRTKKEEVSRKVSKVLSISIVVYLYFVDLYCCTLIFKLLIFMFSF